MAKFEDNLVNTAIKNDAGADPNAEPDYVPQYRIMQAGETKVPVTRQYGKLWQARKNQVMQARKSNGITRAWEEAIAYYRNDQSMKERGNDVTERYNREYARAGDKGTETENVVFANVSAFVPALYAKNPDCEITLNNPAQEDLGSVLERLLDVLAVRKTAPGVNLKPKARRAVVQAVLMNVSYLEVGWTRKQDSSEATMVLIQQLSEKLSKSKDLREIQEIEGQLQALEQRVDVLRPEGPWVRTRYAGDVLVDPDSEEADHSDARWIMLADMLPTDMIKALYAQKDMETNEYKSIYQPTHVIRAGQPLSSSMDDNMEINTASLFSYEETGSTAAAYGYTDDRAFRSACRTRVYYVWDKTTRRVFLYSDADWTWPLWVWDDPYQLPDFFPITPMVFATDPLTAYAKAEVAYYLDQQDAINNINAEMKKFRDWVSGKYAYNKNAIKDSTLVEEFAFGSSSRKVIGVDLPADMDINKVITAIVPPSAEYMNVLVADKQQQFAAIDRLSGVTNVMRGAEFKTNTTNKAIESYESQTQTRLDEKMDAIEDALGDVFQKLAFMTLQFMDAEMVTNLIGPEYGSKWQQLPASDIAYKLSLRITGGSTLKPTSRMKKEMAMQLGGALGQFTSASPVAFYMAAKVFQRAFADDILLTDDEWKLLVESIMQAVQGQAGPQGGAEGGGANDALHQVEDLIDNKLPPKAKEALGAMIAKGVPVKDALAQIVQAVQNSNPNAGPKAG